MSSPTSNPVWVKAFELAGPMIRADDIDVILSMTDPTWLEKEKSINQAKN